MQQIWYRFFRKIAAIGLFFYFKKISVYGKENIPKRVGIIYVANHRNGLIDPILIGTKSGGLQYYLTRASAFKNPVANFLLRSINMLPIYRIRDGVESLGKNQEIFNYCYQKLSENFSIVIFPEGNHGFQRRLRPLSKGFTRIAFGFLEKFPKQKLYIVPVGLNYNNSLLPFQKAAVYFGEPISVNDYFTENQLNDSTENLKKTVSDAIKKVSIHIENVDNYNRIEKQLLAEGYDFLQPKATNARIAEIAENPTENNVRISQKYSLIEKIIIQLFRVNTIFPHLIWNQIKVKDVAMTSTFKYGLGLVMVPLFYLLQSLVIGLVFNKLIAVIYLAMSILLLLTVKQISKN